MKPNRLVVSIAALLAAAGCSSPAGGSSSSTSAPVGARVKSSAPSLGVASFEEEAPAAASDGQAQENEALRDAQPIQATVVVQGIPGAGAIAQVQQFHRGSPMQPTAALGYVSQPGAILESTQILVASTSNFGGPLARPSENPGSILSINPDTGGGNINPNFDSDGSQAPDLGGAVRMFSAQGPAYLNAIHNPNAVTADLPSASLPTGISVNNGHGRPWFSNAPLGAFGYGTITVIDPHGEPLGGAPDLVAGGVFAGDETNRNAQSTEGLTHGALGLALLTKSPDQSTKAVFASVLADGSVVQIHVRDGVDGLAPAGTITPIPEASVAAMESTNPFVISRAGMAFNWAPSRILYIADPYANRIAALDLSDDGHLFQETTRYLHSAAFNLPVDLAPSIPETEADDFSSNTTLGAAADLYVLNRGDNSVVRIRQDGTVIAKRFITADVSGFRVNGIATSATGAELYVSAQTPDHGGVVLRMPAFGSDDVMKSLLADTSAAGASGSVQSMGEFIFSHPFGMNEGVGPLFNGQSCATCHSSPTAGGMGVDPSTHDFRVGRIVDDLFQPLSSPVTRQHSIDELGGHCGLPTGIPADAQIVSTRNTMTLRGTALIDDIQVKSILDNMNAEPAAVRGHPNYLPDGRIGKFGWKAHVATLVEFMGAAFRDEMGVTNSVQPKDLENGCGANANGREIDSTPLVATAAFLNTIDPPVPTSACLNSAGSQIFKQIGCADCHTPSMAGPNRTVNLYSDLLLHDMGPGLADGVVQASANGNEFRTMPLWKLSERTVFLHNGSATTVPQAISAHGGQAAASAQAYGNLSDSEKQAVLDFLGCI